jgi:sugar lactone lactonase YvrE
LDIGAGEVIDVKEDGSKRLLLEGRPRGETNEAGIGPDGDFYLNILDRMWQIDTQSGEVTEHTSILPVCGSQVQSFTFIDPTTILTTGDHLVMADLARAENMVLIKNETLAFATDIGPDDVFYYGMPGCNDEEGTSTIYRVPDQEIREPVLEGIPGTVQDLAFDKDGGLFVYLYDGFERRILYYPSFKDDGMPVAISANLLFDTIAVHPHSGNLFIGARNGTGVWEYGLDGLENRYPLNLPYDINWFHIDFSPDGVLYALATDALWAEKGRTDRWVLRIDLENGNHTLVGETSRNHPGGTYDVMDVDFEGNIWVLVNPERRIFKVSPDGDVSIFAEGVPIDNMAISVDREGDVYFTATSAIFRIYRGDSD